MRALLALLLTIGLTLPAMGAALAEGLGLERVVICQGDRLVTVHLGGDGAPVEIEGHGPCLAAIPSDRPARPMPPASAAAFTVSAEPVPADGPVARPSTIRARAPPPTL
ncbi:hypothetical protein JQC91_01660 [Jannaschia sp. Os4]|uniref:hypothetical protein n=1 Tax=Jannaschia sp. Os4 TaxID=2807617 RepID=UPI00193ABF70|nr:hypothetical protein [Jannaschia sp. Os4]MBM2574998.1 hypothetical protein [Jannaschia sp. Os4]